MTDKNVPESAALIIDFVNTYDPDTEADAIGEPAALTAWLAERGLLHASATTEDLGRARALREEFRALLRANHDGDPVDPVDPAAAAGFDPLAAQLPLRAELADGVPSLTAAGTGTDGGLAQLVAATVRCGYEGSWTRLKVCGDQTCEWAFYDLTRNRSRSWCSMRVCGNRTKTRAYRERHRTG